MKSKVFILSALALSVLSACNFSINQNNLTKNINSSVHVNARVITGKLKFTGNFKTKSTVEKLAKKATVTLIYPNNYFEDELKNSTVAAGISDENGNFRISFGSDFTPFSGTTFILEAVKRSDDIGSELVSLRTNIQINEKGWKSITGDKTYLSLETTVLSCISSLTPDNLSPENTIDKIKVNNDESFSFLDIYGKQGKFSLNDLTGYRNRMEDILNNDEDPVKAFKYDKQKENYYISLPNKKES